MDSLILEPRYLFWLWDGFLVTLAISLLTIIIATLLGFLLAMAKISQIKFITYVVTGYIAFFRYSPLLPQLFFWYFGIGNLLPIAFKELLFDQPQITLGFLTFSVPSFEFLIGLIGLTFYSSAFVAEELSAGILGVSQGQFHASMALGLTRWQTLRLIILPQACSITFPPLVGQYMNIVKNSSLTMAIGVLELSYVSRQIETESLKTFQDFALTTLLYLIAVTMVGMFGYLYQTHRLTRQKRN